jgi:hypothetical protein
VPLGDSEIIRFGSFAIFVVNPPDEIVSGYFVAAACAGLTSTDAKTIATIATAGARKRALDIKNSLNNLREENWAKKQ